MLVRRDDAWRKDYKCQSGRDEWEQTRNLEYTANASYMRDVIIYALMRLMEFVFL